MRDYDRLFNLSLDLLCIAGLDGYFKKVNPSWTRVLGWSEAELLARPVADFMHPDDRERTLQARANLAKGIPLRGLENRYLCKDGSYRWLAWQSNVEVVDGTVFAVARDITERRQLDHERLIRSKLESTQILAGGIAHDFNNLLTAIMANLGMVAMCGATTEEQRKYLCEAEQAVLGAKSLTLQLVAFAQGGTSTRRAIDLKDLLRQSMARALTDSHVRHECVLAPDLWPAEVDELQIRQVINGLVSNAREATPPGGTILLKAENVVLDSARAAAFSPGNYLRITVADSGSGIAPEVLSQIFDPYFSTKNRSTQKGMGLSLSICRTVIQEHSGTIAVDSHPGRGTRVTCHLPAQAAPNGRMN